MLEFNTIKRALTGFVFISMMLSAGALFAQDPVQVLVNAIPPGSLKLSDYYSGSTKRLVVTLVNRDIRKTGLNVYLKLTVTGANGVVLSNNIAGMPTISLNGGVPVTLSNSDLTAYFNVNNLNFSGFSKTTYQTNGALPEGFYQFQVQVFDKITNQKIGSGTSNTIQLSLNQPPSLLLPTNNSTIDYAEPLNLHFSWMPRYSTYPGYTTTYTFQMIQLLDTSINPASAFTSRNPTFTYTTSNTSFVYGPGQPALIKGTKYVWRVLVNSTNSNNEQEPFSNSGYSEVFWFTYSNNCNVPAALESFSEYSHVDGYGIDVSWVGTGVQNYNLQYREARKDSADWISIPVQTTNDYPDEYIPNVQPNKNYEIRVGNGCGTTNYLYSDDNFVNVPVHYSGAYTLIGQIIDQSGHGIANAKVACITHPAYSAITTSVGAFSITIPIDVIDSFTVTSQYTKPYTFTKSFLYGGDDAYDPSSNLISEDNWEGNLLLSQVALKYNLAKPADLGLGNYTDRQSAYNSIESNFMANNLVLLGAIDMYQVLVQSNLGKIRFSAAYSSDTGRVSVSINGGPGRVITKGNYLDSFMAPGTYSYTLSQAPGGFAFSSQTGTFTVPNDDSINISVKINPSVTVSGTIKDNAGNGIDTATVSVIGLPYSTKTDKNGNYSFTVPFNQEITLDVAAAKYNSRDSNFIFGANGKVSFVLTLGNDPGFLYFAGYPATITKCTSAPGGNFTVSGTLLIASNNAFSPTDSVLTFKNILVATSSSNIKNAVPLGDVTFVETKLNATIFGFLPVEIDGSPGIRLRAASAGNGQYAYDNGIIGGDLMKALLHSSPVGNQSKLKLPDGVLTPQLGDATAPDPNRTSGFAYAYTPPGYNINGLDSGVTYNLSFDMPTIQTNGNVVTLVAPADTGTIFDLSKTMHIKGFIASGATLSQTGINMNGYIQLPKCVGAKFVQDGKLIFDTLNIDNNFNVAKATFEVNTKKPLGVKMKKIQAYLTSVTVMNWGSDDLSFGFGGYVILGKSSAPSKQDTINIVDMSYAKSNGDYTINATLNFVNGIGIKGLNFSTPDGQVISVTYSSASQSYLIAGQGQLDYHKPSNAKTKTKAKSSDSKDGIISGAFPIAIDSFSLNTSNWALYMAASTNATLNLGRASVNLQKLVVNIGESGVSMDDMNNYLTGASSDPDVVDPGAQETDDSTELDEDNCSWAIGVKGSISFDVSSIYANANAEVVIGNINNQIDIVVDTINVQIQAASVKCAGYVVMVANDTVTGFAGGINLDVMNHGFDADFHYYTYIAGQLNGYRDMGADINIYIGPLGLVTGPVKWYSIGGGFTYRFGPDGCGDFTIFLNGDIGSPAITKDKCYVQGATLTIDYVGTAGSGASGCPGVAPVTITATGNLMVKNELWCTGDIDLDLCAGQLTVEVDCDITVMKDVTADVHGLIYLTKDQVFLGVTGTAQALDSLITANCTVLFGYNADVSDTTTGAGQFLNHIAWPTYYALQNKIVDLGPQKLNAIAIFGSINQGSYIEKDCGLGVSVSMGYGISASGIVYYKFTDNQFYINLDMNGNLNGNVSFLDHDIAGISINGDANLVGGYDSRWYMKASLDLSGSVEVLDQTGDFDVSGTLNYDQNIHPQVSFSLQ